MTRRLCLDCGITTANGSRCTRCVRSRDAARGTTSDRGYGADHQAERKRLARILAGTGWLTCAKCGGTIHRTDPWDLGHSDDRTTWTGPEHATCNRAHGGAQAHRERPAPRPPSTVRPSGVTGPSDFHGLA